MELPLQLRPIRFPLKLKLIGLFSLVLLGSLTAYAHYALTRFIEDKSAYIYSSVQDVVQDQARDINRLIQQGERTLKMLTSIEQADISKRIFESYHGFVDYREFDLKDNIFTLGIDDPNTLLQYELNSTEVETKTAQVISQIKAAPENQTIYYYLFENKPLVTLATKKNHKIQIALLALGDALNSKNENIQQVLYSPQGSALNNGARDKSLWQFIDDNFKRRMLHQGVQEQSTGTSSNLVSVQITNNDYPISAAIIDRSQAFAVADNLIKKSYLFAIFLLSLATIIGVLFARTLTRSLEILFNGTQRFVQGDFESRVQVESKDEIGALSDSFNYMGQRIVDYMDEMKEKLRLEREVEVAKLVQDSFFPEANGNLESAEFAAFYAPTSECGGDWWGHLNYQNKSAIFIADATGHGVPAALITAAANCCLHTLDELIKQHPSLIDDPAKMLEWFNRAICGAGKQLYMTMFCLVIDPQNKTLTWANAAHNPVLLLPSNIANPTRQDLVSLMTPPSPHLGKANNSNFAKESRSYNDGDTLVFYTDGLLENTNQEDHPYGERRFHQSITTNVNNDLRLWRDQIVKPALQHSGGAPNLDDVTLVLCRLGATQAPTDIEVINKQTVISHLEADHALDYLHANPHINHLIGANSPRLQDEIELLPPFTNQYNFIWNGHSIEEFRNTFDDFLTQQTFTGWFESPRDYLRLIGDELVTNALSPESAQVSVKLCLNHEGIIVEVEDNRGALKRDTLIDALKRARDSHAPRGPSNKKGAGLGLYLVYQSTNQIWLNVIPNKSTKVVCVLETTKRYKNFRSRLTSFHFQEIP